MNFVLISPTRILLVDLIQEQEEEEIVVYEWKGFLQMTDEKMIVEHNFHVTLENFIKSLWLFFVL